MTRGEGKVEAFILFRLVEKTKLIGSSFNSMANSSMADSMAKRAGTAPGRAWRWECRRATDEAGGGAKVGDAITVGRGFAAASE